MHRDKKLGLALGILLIGVVGAFFFRNEADPLEDLPELQDVASLDAQIAEQPIAPYLMPPEFNENSKAAASDELPEFLREPAGGGEAAGPPGPIITRSNDLAAAESMPVPEHNRAWTVKLSEPATAADPATAASDTGPRTHRVQQGDTLSGLAQRYLGSSTRFMDLYTANRDVLRSPDDLRVGMTIRIPAPASAARPAAVETPSVTQPVSSTQVNPAPASAPNSPPQTRVDEATVPPASAPQPGEPPRRFVPARRPFWPARSLGNGTTHLQPTSGPVRTLTQIPPVDLQAGHAAHQQ